MDWVAAIEKNREALRRILSMLLAMAGLLDHADRAKTPFLPRRLHRAILRLLRPAEAAVRRLIIVAARDIVVAPAAQAASGGTPGDSLLFSAGRRSGLKADVGGKKVNCPLRLSLPLFDALPRWRRRPTSRTSGVPRIWVPGYTTPFAIVPRRPPLPDDPVPAARLGSRLALLGRVLDDLPRAARRFARWQAKVLLALRAPTRKTFRVWPLRPGRPPGSLPLRRKTGHEVHDILSVVHGLAFWAMERRDTS